MDDSTWDFSIIDEDGDPLFGDRYEGVLLEADFSTDPDHPRPLLMEPRDWSETEIDFASGSSTIGALRVGLLDRPTNAADQDSGIISSFIEDAQGRRGVLRRFREDFGRMVTVFDGVIHNITMDSESIVVYWLQVRDPRDLERQETLFSRNETFVVYGKDGTSGPRDPYGQLPGGGFLLEGVEPFVSQGGLLSPIGMTIQVPVFSDELAELGEPVLRGDGFWVFENVAVEWRPVGGTEEDWIVLRDIQTSQYMPFHWEGQQPLGIDFGQLGGPRILLNGGLGTLPGLGQQVEVRVLAAKTSPETPFFWDRGTIGDLALAAMDGEFSDEPLNQRFNREAFEEFADETPPARMTTTETHELREFMEQHIYAAVGAAPTFDEDMQTMPIFWFLPDVDEELPLLNEDRLVPVGDLEYSLDNVVNDVTYTYVREFIRELTEDEEASSEEIPAWKRLSQREVVIRRISAPSLGAGLPRSRLEISPITIRAIGTVDGRPSSGDVQDEVGAQTASMIATEVITRFQFGSAEYRVPALIDDPEVMDLRVGEWVRVHASWLPESRVLGKRGKKAIMQVFAVSDEEPHVRMLSLIEGSLDDSDFPEECEEPLSCFLATGAADTWGEGDYEFFVFTGPGEIRALADCEVECVAIAQGGDGGDLDGAAQGDDTTLWSSLGGEALDPETDTPPLEHRAIGGGVGATGIGGAANGGTGGSGGGAGAQSPWFTTGHGSGGSGLQGSDGGSSMAQLGLSDRRLALSGSGGGPAGLATSLPLPVDWIALTALGGLPGHGSLNKCAQQIQAAGMGGGGGWRVFSLTVKQGEVIPVRVGGGQPGKWGAGGRGRLSHFLVVDPAFPCDPPNASEVIPASPGWGGIMVLRALRSDVVPADTPAVLDGGTLVERFGWRYHLFTVPGEHSLGVTTPGWAEAIVGAAGTGGASGVGGGGPGGDVRKVDRVSLEAALDVVVGAKGVGVVGEAGTTGGESRIGDLIRALGDGSGRGGDGPNGEGETGTPGRGYRGGDGTNMAPGGEVDPSVPYAGGGGAVGGPGEDGAERDGFDLSEDWDGSIGTGVSAYHVDPEERRLRINVGSTISKLNRKDVDLNEMLVQAVVRWEAPGDNCRPGLTARFNGQQRGYRFQLTTVSTNQAGIYVHDNSSFGSLVQTMPNLNARTGEDVLAQLYVADGVQEGYAGGESVVGGNTALDTETGSSGVGTQSPSSGSQPAWYDDHVTFPTKYIRVTDLPGGWKAKVRDAGGALVSEATESSGTASVDVSIGGGVTGGVPLTGWPTLEVTDGADVVQATLAGVFLPGFVGGWDGSEVQVTQEGGPVAFEDFNEFTPGPTKGNGGDGYVVPEDWRMPEGRVLHYIHNSFNQALQYDEPPASDRHQVLAWVRSSSTATDVRMRVVARMSTDPNDGYYAELSGSGDRFRLVRRLNNSETNLAQTGTFQWSADTNYLVLLEVETIGGTHHIRGKFWELGTAEPAGWTLETTDTAAIPSGKAGVSARQVGTQSFVFVAVGVDGADAPRWHEGGQLGENQFVEVFGDAPAGVGIPPGWSGAWAGADDQETRWEITTHEDHGWMPSPVAGIPERMAGGGGGASEADVAGTGGIGGGGDGTREPATAGGTATEPGAGGGGARDPASPGGDGGDGWVGLRMRALA